jgi:hypothetical protein
MPHLIPEIPVVFFHSVAPEKFNLWTRNYLTLELIYFEAFLEYLKKNKWQTIFLDEYYSIRKSAKNPPKHVCCITFDDGFLDNYIYCYPLLKKYGFKGTIFINPEFIDLKRKIAKTLENVWGNEVNQSEISQLGYLSWDEIRLMQKSGVIDIQSHTLTHTMYFVSDELISFHRPDKDCLYPIGNLFPDRKPYYINDKEFERLIPYGTPFFKESSAVIGKRVFINKAFNNAIVKLLSDYKWNQMNAIDRAYEIVSSEYQLWKNKNEIIENIETQAEYEKRLYDEIVGSKNIIEDKLGKKIHFLCWPHGDNTETTHKFALDAGYLATTSGSKQKIQQSVNRIPVRANIGVIKNNVYLTSLKMRYRMSIAEGNAFMKLIQSVFQKL